MKTTSRNILVLCIFLSGFLALTEAYGQQKKSDTVVIQSSVVCGMCKERIEGTLAFEKGIKSSSVDIEAKSITVVYNPSRTGVPAIRKIISKLGYDADTVAADPAAYAKLPACCKKDAPPH